jgi:hypothetical protein
MAKKYDELIIELYQMIIKQYYYQKLKYSLNIVEKITLRKY